MILQGELIFRVQMSKSQKKQVKIELCSLVSVVTTNKDLFLHLYLSSVAFTSSTFWSLFTLSNPKYLEMSSGTMKFAVMYRKRSRALQCISKLSESWKLVTRENSIKGSILRSLCNTSHYQNLVCYEAWK